MVAEVAARWVLEAQAGAPPDTLAAELEAGADFHFAVHNAAGVVSVQQDISVTEALIRLRAFAFSSDRLLADVARDVIARRLRLDDPAGAGGWSRAGVAEAPAGGLDGHCWP